MYLQSGLVQLLCVVCLCHQLLGVRIVAERLDRRIGDHEGLQMEATVSNIAAKEREKGNGKRRKGNKRRDSQKNEGYIGIITLRVTEIQ